MTSLAPIEWTGTAIAVLAACVILGACAFINLCRSKRHQRTAYRRRLFTESRRQAQASTETARRRR